MSNEETILAELASLRSEVAELKRSITVSDMLEQGGSRLSSPDWFDAGAGSFNLDRLDFWYKITSRVERTVDINGGYFKHALARYSV
ncbi:MAG: hypothetical protein WC551_12775, partial [Patescibacteria group bacterium]